MLIHASRFLLPASRAHRFAPRASGAAAPSAAVGRDRSARFGAAKVLAAAVAFALACALLALALPVPARAADYTVGEIRRINKETKKITLRHGEIKSLEMPAMTMAFGVRDPKVLEDLKVGDKVRFLAIKDPSGELIVTSIRPAQ